jgi:hypothetical protein
MYGLYVNHDLIMISSDVAELFDQVVYLSMSDDAIITKLEEE